MSTKSASRREFLVRGGVGAVALLNGAALVEAGQATDSERTNIKLVNDFCGAFATHEIDRIGLFLAETAVWRPDNGSFATGMPAVGREAILARIGRFLDRIVEFKVVQSFATGTVVVNERFDRFMPERTLHLAGVFYVKDRKIVEWTDFLAS